MHCLGAGIFLQEPAALYAFNSVIYTDPQPLSRPPKSFEKADNPQPLEKLKISVGRFFTNSFEIVSSQ